jgi:accessory gene regulator protein AgrB
MLDILKSRNQKEALYNLLVFSIFVVLMTVIMQFLWNGTLVKHITILKPVDSLLQTFLLALGIALFRL